MKVDTLTINSIAYVTSGATGEGVDNKLSSMKFTFIQTNYHINTTAAMQDGRDDVFPVTVTLNVSLQHRFNYSFNL